MKHGHKDVIRLAAFLLLTLSFACAQAETRVANHGSAIKTSDQRFDVRHSIEMERFERSGGMPQFSPDGKFFSIVTSRGHVQSDRVESTLRVFRSQEVIQYLRGKRWKRPRGRILFRASVTPEAEYHNSYEPMISSIQWSVDSKSIFFLVQNARGTRQLCRAALGSGEIRTLTPAHQNISQFESKSKAIIYRALSENSSRLGVQINADARDITSIALSGVLFPRLVSEPTESSLWVLRESRITPIRDAKTRRLISLLDMPPPIPGWNPLSLSPDGQRAVVLLPVKSIPKSWERYEPAIASLKLESQATVRRGGALRTLPTQYALINLRNAGVLPLVDAPNAYLLGYGSRNLAIWSPSGSELLLTNTYLPLDLPAGPQKIEHLRPCAALVMNLVSGQRTCLAFDKGEKVPLLNASFGGRGDIVLQFAGEGPLERYQCLHGKWQTKPTFARKTPRLMADDINSNSASSALLSVVIRQDLNTPAKLWANDPGAQLKEIWDPNPQLEALALGEATIYHWKDKTGYEWEGGLVKPPDYQSGRRYPLVIQTHGFEPDEFLSDGQYTTAFSARPLASTGMMVLQMADRFDDLGTAAEAPNRILGFESAIDRLVAEGLIDRHRVGIIGFSRTCYHVESALIKDPQLFAAATIADGVDESYMQYMLWSVGQSSKESEGLYGEQPFGPGLKTWVERAPSFHLDQLRTPLRIEAITARSVLSEWEMYASLWRQGKPVDLIYFPKGQHILQRPLERMASQQGNVDWFRFWLKGEEDDEPAKAEQYERWRALKQLLKHHVGGMSEHQSTED